MTDLLYTPADNVGGLHLIRFAEVVGVTSLTGVTPLFRAGFGWHNAYCSPFSGRYEEEPNETDNGTVYTMSIEGFWPGAGTATERAQLEQMMQHRFLVEVTDLNGSLRLAGSPLEGLSFSYRFRSGQAVGDRRGYVLTWAGPLTRIPPMV